MAMHGDSDDALASFVIKNLDTGDVMPIGEADAYMEECRLSTFHNTAFGGQPVTVKMENAYTASDHGGGGKDHTEYALTVTVHATNDKWSITKRYREFAQLHDRLRAISFAGVKRLSLPPKRLFDNLAEGVITQRKQALEQYLNAVLSHAHSLRDVPPLRFFLQCPERLLPYTEREHPSKGGRAGATASSPAAASDSGSGVVMPLRPTGLVSLADAARMYPEYQRRRR